MDPMEWFAWNLKQWRDELTKTDLDDKKQVERLYNHVKAQQTIRWELMCEWLRKSDGEIPYDSEPWLSSEEPPSLPEEQASASAAEVVNSMSPDALQRELNKLSSILSDDEVSDIESLPRDKRDKHKDLSDLLSGEESVSESSWSSKERPRAKAKSAPKEKLQAKKRALVTAKLKAKREKAKEREREREREVRELSRKLRRSLSPIVRGRKSPLRISRPLGGTECYRCGKLGHRYRDCREIWCRKCKFPDVTVRTCPNCRFEELDNNNWSVVRKRPISPVRRIDKSPPSARRRIR